MAVGVLYQEQGACRASLAVEVSSDTEPLGLISAQNLESDNPATWGLHRHLYLGLRGGSRIFERGALFWKSIGAGSKGATGARAPKIF